MSPRFHLEHVGGERTLASTHEASGLRAEKWTLKQHVTASEWGILPFCIMYIILCYIILYCITLYYIVLCYIYIYIYIGSSVKALTLEFENQGRKVARLHALGGIS